jgi:CheY-like chemotaxis protein
MKLERVLLVDDDSISNHLSKVTLNKINAANEVIVKTDGRDALKYIQKECKSMSQYPELILLDLKMPGMDGFEFLEEFEMVCKDVRHHIVVVILTSSRNADDVIRLRRLGNYFIVNKPLSAEKVDDILHRYFRDGAVFH